MNNIQAHKHAKLEELLQTLKLSSANMALALEYLESDSCDDSLLSRAQPQNFRDLDARPQYNAGDYLDGLRKGGDGEQANRLIKLYWAIGKSTAVFLLAGSSVQLDHWAQLLGKPAAAAMQAERCVWHVPFYSELKWLYQLAASEPQVLEEAQTLGGTPFNNMCLLLAGILLNSAKAGLFQKLIGGKGTLAGRQTDLLTRSIVDCMDTMAPTLQDADRRNLAAYIQAGKPEAPLPSLVVPTAAYADLADVLSTNLTSPYLTGLLGTASFLGQRQDARLRCALRVYAVFNPNALLQAVLKSSPPAYLLEQLDTLIQDVPGGQATLLLALAQLPHEVKKPPLSDVVQRCKGGARQALDAADTNTYLRLSQLLPEAAVGTARKQLDKIAELLQKQVQSGKADLQAYLTDTGSLQDSLAQLAPITVAPYVYPTQAASVLSLYQKEAGWDTFACRCAVVLGLVFQGRGMDTLLQPDGSTAALAQALLDKGLPFAVMLTLFGNVYDSLYWETRKTELRNSVYEAVKKPSYLAELCIAAKEGNVFARQVALSALDDLAALPDCAQQAKAGILACTTDTSKQVQTLLLAILAAHPDWAGDFAELLKSKKSAQRLLAAAVAAKLGDTLRPALKEALAAEKSAKVADAIRTALGQAPAQGESGPTANPANPDELAAQVLKGGKRRRIQWVLDTPLPTLHLEDGTPVSEERRDALLAAYCELGRIGRSETAALLAAGIGADDLAALAGQVYEAWLAAGAQSKNKWVLAFSAVFGGPAMTARLNHAINEWPQHARGAIACDAVTALTLSSDPAALLIVDAISRKFKFRQVKAAAGVALEGAAQELGITPDELADRIVPTLGFSADGTRIFDYGTRSFTVRLTPTLELEITNDSGKRVKNLPAPGKTDDPEKADQAYQAFKDMKKQIRTAAATQKSRLEAALAGLRCWGSDAWQALFVENPLMHQFAVSLIWGIYDEQNQLQTTFRYMEDGSFTTADEEEYQLPQGARIGLAHPVELEPELLSAWKQQLEDYEITQSIPQLERPVYRLEPGMEEKRRLETFGGRMLNGLSLSGKLTGMGWFRGSVQDGGGYYTFYREDPSLGLGVELNFSGCYIGDENETVTVYDGVFYKPGTVKRGSYCYDTPKDEDIFPLGQVPPRYYSEIVYQLERATASSTEHDPDWRNKKG